MLEELSDRGLVLDVEPVDAQLDVKLLGQGSRQLDVKPRLLTLRGGVRQVSGVHADDQLSPIPNALPGIRR